MTTKIITITVTYDDSLHVPSSEELKHAVFAAVGDGLLTFDEDDSIVDAWEVTVQEK